MTRNVKISLLHFGNHGPNNKVKVIVQFFAIKDINNYNNDNNESNNNANDNNDNNDDDGDNDNNKTPKSCLLCSHHAMF